MGADLIVLSTHGRSGFDRFALGSVTEKVLRKASCPVLVVPAHDERPPQPFTSYTHVVCAVDFSECSKRAMAVAGSLAAQSGATLTLAHVIEARERGAAPKGSAIAMLRETQLESAREEMQAAGAALRAARATATVSIDEVIVFGIPHDELLRLADERRAGILVVGVRGRNAVDLTIFGSTTNQLVRRARIPVLTVRT
jgi:nucleotide-binding universal stress UspA family protein